MEENRSFSWTNLFIKIILGIIFILFAVWLISLSNKGLSDSLNVLTEDIFAKNIERMKEVGKEYFTTERLPEKVGDIKTLTLEKMYDKNLILELKDKYGNACSAENSYVSIEKFDNEYQMKVYLECGEESDYVIVIMGCYDYCETDICELKETEDEAKAIEYEYKKTTGGKWTDWGNWSEWSKVSVTKTDYRQVETKTEMEEYTYNKEITETIYTDFVTVCPERYQETSDGTKCYKTVYTDSYADPECPTLSGWTLTGRDGFTCNYKKNTTTTEDPICPTLSGWTLTGRDGFTCNYKKSSTVTTDPICPSKSGWTYTGRSGFTCNYKRTVESSSYTLEYVETRTGSYVPADTDTYAYVQVSADYVYDCSNGCAFRWIYTYKVYKKVYGTTIETTTDTASCPSGYSKSGNTCEKTSTSTTTDTAICPSGYSKSGNTCAKTSTTTKTDNAECPSGYNKSGNSCLKTVSSNEYKDKINACPSGYSATSDGIQCYKNITSTVPVTGTREVTYYRYRLREYVGGTVDYKWSTSKEDKSLLDAEYKLTGRTR